jgi:hypothetical protein
MNDPKCADWSHIPPYAVWLFAITALGWIVGPVLGFYLGGKRERTLRICKAYDTFHAVVASQFAGLNANRWSESEFFRQSVPVLTEAVYALRPFLSSRDWTSVYDLLRQYQSHHESEFEGGYTRLAAALKNESSPSELHHFELLLDYMERFSKITKEPNKTSHATATSRFIGNVP